MPSIPFTRRSTLAIVAVGLAALATPVLAQSNARVRATVVGLEGDRLTLRTKDDLDLKVRLAEPVSVSARVRADPSTVKPGSYVGAAAVPGKNGSLAGVEVVIFPETSRGAGEGHRPMDLLPDSTMTNATVSDEVMSVDGKTLKLTYKGGEQTLTLTPDTRIFVVVMGSLADLKPGAIVNLTIDKDAAGDLATKRITVDR